MLDISKRHGAAPFDTGRLDQLMDDAGIDVLLATSKHNVQYLLGGHRAFFFDTMDAIGVTRYLPVFVYPKGAPQKAGYFGHRMEGYQTAVKPFWVSEVNIKSSGAIDVMERAAAYVRQLMANRAASESSSASCRQIPRPRCAKRSPIPSLRMRCSCSSGCAPAKRRRSWRSCGSRRIWSSIQ
jgi:Xaa-Pro aminopeptidase